MSKKSKKIKIVSVSKLHKICSELWKAICYARDGHICQVQRYFHYIVVSHTDILQVDHCFSRKDKNLFYEPKNGTVVCSGCNFNKSVKNKSVDYAISKIVEAREGEEAFAKMLFLNQTGKPNVDFNKRWWLEQKIIELEQEKKLYEKAVC